MVPTAVDAWIRDAQGQCFGTGQCVRFTLAFPSNYLVTFFSGLFLYNCERLGHGLLVARPRPVRSDPGTALQGKGARLPTALLVRFRWNFVEEANAVHVRLPLHPIRCGPFSS